MVDFVVVDGVDDFCVSVCVRLIFGFLAADRGEPVGRPWVGDVAGGS